MFFFRHYIKQIKLYLKYEKLTSGEISTIFLVLKQILQLIFIVSVYVACQSFFVLKQICIFLYLKQTNKLENKRY
jgi:hypothetical protein